MNLYPQPPKHPPHLGQAGHWGEEIHFGAATGQVPTVPSSDRRKNPPSPADRGRRNTTRPANGPFDTWDTVDGEHGRIETRRYFTTSDLCWLLGKNEWPGMNTICMAVPQREVHGKTSTEKAYFISSLANQAPTIAKAIRAGVSKTACIGALDIAFREDQCRVRKVHGPENLAILRHLATNMLKREHSLQGGMQTKRLKAAWDQTYLLKVFTT